MEIKKIILNREDWVISYIVKTEELESEMPAGMVSGLARYVTNAHYIPELGFRFNDGTKIPTETREAKR